MNYMIFIIIAVIGGVAMSMQGLFMGIMDQVMGTKESVFITYGSGGLIVSLYMLFTGCGNLQMYNQVPWYAFTAGFMGLIIVGAISFTAPRLGLVTAFTILVVTQFFISALIDHFGIFGVEIRQIDFSRTAGLALMLSGVWLIIRN
ncbi:MAG: DMT family transporter [Desulfobacterales bacterium]|nr:DMT family transporter [Desulfobacterales bacterium]